jgi:hypothetical protein
MPSGPQNPAAGMAPPVTAPVPPYAGGSVASTSDQGSPQLTMQQQLFLSEPPAVPGRPGPNGSGATVVDTASLDTVARNMNALIGYVQDAMSVLSGISVKPGTFAAARELTAQLMGPADQAPSTTAPTGQAPAFKLVLSKLVDSLSSTQATLQTMSQKYQTADELNNASATDVQNDLSQAQTLITAMLTANGATPPTGSGSGSGGS